MAEGIELTAQQAGVVAKIASSMGPVVVRQLSDGDEPGPQDVYVTVAGTHHGRRITPAGEVSDMGETLPAHE
jgi:hypothetical protein